MDDAIAGMVLTLCQYAGVAIVLTQAVQNVKYLSMHWGLWTIFSTALALAAAVNWDLRLIEGIVQKTSAIGPISDNIVTGWILSGGVSSIYNMAKKSIKVRQELHDLKVDTLKAK